MMLGVGVWVGSRPLAATMPSPPGSSPGQALALSGRAGEGTDVAGEVVSAVVKGAGCGARIAHRVDGAAGVNESGSTTLTKMIRSAEEYDSAMSRIDEIFCAPVGTPAGDELDLLVNQVEVYEAERYPISPPDPVDAIEFRIDQVR